MTQHAVNTDLQRSTLRVLARTEQRHHHSSLVIGSRIQFSCERSDSVDRDDFEAKGVTRHLQGPVSFGRHRNCCCHCTRRSTQPLQHIAWTRTVVFTWGRRQRGN